MTHKAKNIYSLSLERKSLVFPGLTDRIVLFTHEEMESSCGKD